MRLLTNYQIIVDDFGNFIATDAIYRLPEIRTVESLRTGTGLKSCVKVSEK